MPQHLSQLESGFLFCHPLVFPDFSFITGLFAIFEYTFIQVFQVPAPSSIPALWFSTIHDTMAHSLPWSWCLV